jgi:cyclic dehypoxanthinyl futalosine synthase
MITRQQAIDMFQSDDLVGIGMAADGVRKKIHPNGIVSYIIDRNINYTNFCTEYCLRFGRLWTWGERAF